MAHDFVGSGTRVAVARLSFEPGPRDACAVTVGTRRTAIRRSTRQTAIDFMWSRRRCLSLYVSALGCLMPNLASLVERLEGAVGHDGPTRRKIPGREVADSLTADEHPAPWLPDHERGHQAPQAREILGDR